MESQDHMESNSTEPPKGITSYDLGIGRSYDCVFCKRGFTTAQALGGHMNIHRKDRTKPKLNPSSSSSNHQRYLIASSRTDSTGVLPLDSVQEIQMRKSSKGGFNMHQHVVVEELDLELRLGHRSS